MKINFSLFRRLKNTWLISAVFTLVLMFYLASMYRYWHTDLEPRLKESAATQANTLAQSQMRILLRALEIDKPEQRRRVLNESIAEILLVTDPSIDEAFIKGLALEVDYDVVDAAPGSLEQDEGLLACAGCFAIEVPIINARGEYLAIATFNVTNAYFDVLSEDISSKLNNQILFTVMLFFTVWLAVIFFMVRLHELKEKIAQSDRAKTRFMANVSHELRTPLNVIMGYTQLFKKEQQLMTQHGPGVETIHQSAEHLLLMINDILDFSKADSKALQLTPPGISTEGLSKNPGGDDIGARRPQGHPLY